MHTRRQFLKLLGLGTVSATATQPIIERTTFEEGLKAYKAEVYEYSVGEKVRYFDDNGDVHTFNTLKATIRSSKDRLHMIHPESSSSYEYDEEWDVYDDQIVPEWLWKEAKRRHIERGLVPEHIYV